MTRRPGIETTVRIETNGGTSTNAYAPYISAHIRVFWPPRATDVEIEYALNAAVDSARACIARKRSEQ